MKRISIVFLVAIFTISCHKKESPKNCQSPYFQQTVQINLSNAVSDVETKRSDFNGEYPSFYSMGDLEHDDFQALFDWNSIGVHSDVYRVEIILSADLKSAITMDNVYAILITQIVDGQLLIKYYKNHQGILKHQEGFDIISSKYYTGFANLVRDECYLSGRTENLGILSFTSLELRNQVFTGTRSNYEIKKRKLKRLIQEMSVSKADLPGGDLCPYPCYRDPHYPDCQQTVDGYYYCDAEDKACEMTAQRSALMSTNNEIDDGTIAQAYDINLHTNFRDNFLSQSATGTLYANMYQDFSDHLKSVVVPPVIQVKTMWFLFDANTKINMLQDPVNYGNDILIDAAFENQLNDLLADYENLSSDPDYLQLISQVKQDVLLYKGKTVHQILTNL